MIQDISGSRLQRVKILVQGETERPFSVGVSHYQRKGLLGSQDALGCSTARQRMGMG